MLWVRDRSFDRDIGRFDPRSALRAQIRMAGEERDWIDPELFHPR
jgi:hypothetical protein